MANAWLHILCLAALLCSALGQRGQRGVIIVKPGETRQMKWVTSPPPSDVLLCCGGSLVLAWSQMDGGVDRSVAVNNDNLCPSTLQNQQYVQQLAQAAPRGLVTLNTRTPELNYDGDYYISSTMGQQCVQGMQFLLAIRGCGRENPTYSPREQIAYQQACAVPTAPGAAGAAGGLNATSALAGVAAPAAASPAPRSGAGVAGVAAASVVAAAAGAAVLLL